MNEEHFNERIERYLSGEMSEADRASFENEILDDPDLAGAIYKDAQVHAAVAAAAERKRQERVEAVESTAATSRKRAWWKRPMFGWVVPAAAVVVITALALWNPIDRDFGGDVFRGAETSFVAVAPSGDLNDTPLIFTWTRHPQASQYRFELYDAQSVRVHTVVTTDTAVVLTSDDIPAPASGHWTTTPLGPNQSSVGPAAVSTFRVTR